MEKSRIIFETGILIVYPPNKKLVFKPVIAPSDDNYDVKKLDSMLREIEGFNRT